MARMLWNVSLLLAAAMAAGGTAVPSSGEGAEGCDTADASLMQTSPQRRLLDAKLLTEQEANEPCLPPAVTIPSQYVYDCWHKGKVCCVGGNLYASVMGPNPGPTDRVYPANHTYAWFGSRDDMETGLRLRKKYGPYSEMTTLGLEIAVGFNPLNTDFGAVGGGPGFAWLVLEQPKNVAINTPSWSQFFYLLEQEGISFGYEAVKNITTAYANLAAWGPPYDAVQAFTRLTNCSRECLVPVGGDINISADCGCLPEVVTAWNEVLVKWTQDETPGDSIDCFKALYKFDKDPCAGVLRVAFQACVDALPVFTGIGLGYNTLVSPLLKTSCKQPVYKRYGGREFIMKNKPLYELNNTKTARYIDLKTLSTAIINSPSLVNDYC